MKINLTHNFPDIAKQLTDLHADVAAKAMASAMNKTVAQAKTAMRREITAEFNITTAKVNDALRVNRARAFRGEFSLEASLESPSKRGRSLNLINFMERAGSLTAGQIKKRSKAGTLNQLHVQIKKSGGKKALRSAFIGNKGRTIFIRTGKERLPIKALQTIDVGGMFNTRKINAKVLQMIEDKFPQVFAHEAKYFTDKFSRKG
jgi:Prophage minor tail protein Z (GPZ)